MAMARKRPDGLYDVEIGAGGAGGTVPMALTEQQLDRAGIQVMSDEPEPGMSVEPSAGGAPGAPWKDTGAGGSYPSWEDTGAGGGPAASPKPGALGYLKQGIVAAPYGMPPGAPPRPQSRERRAQELVAETQKTPVGTAAPPPERPLPETEEVPGPEMLAAPPRQRQRVLRTPAQDVRAAWTHELGVDMAPGTAEAFTKPSEQADVMRVQAATAQSQEVEAALQQRQQQLEQQGAELEERRARREAIDRHVEGLRDEIDTREGALRTATNPTEETYWKEQGVVARLISAVSVTLGGYLQGVSKSPNNMGYQMQRDAVNGWIQDQKAKYERLEGHRDASRNAYADAIERYGTPETAELGMRIESSALADAMLESRLKKAGLYDSLVEVQDRLVQNAQDRERMKLQLQTMERGRITEQWRHIPESVQVVGGAKPKAIDRMVRLPDGRYVWGRTPKAARESGLVIQANDSIRKIAEEIRELSSKPENRVTGSEGWARIQGLSGELTFQYKEGSKAGTLDEGLKESMRTMKGKPAAFFWTGGAAEKLKVMSQQAQQKINSEIRYNLHQDPAAATPLVGGIPQSTQRR